MLQTVCNQGAALPVCTYCLSTGTVDVCCPRASPTQEQRFPDWVRDYLRTMFPKVGQGGGGGGRERAAGAAGVHRRAETWYARVAVGTGTGIADGGHVPHGWLLVVATGRGSVPV